MKPYGIIILISLLVYFTLVIINLLKNKISKIKVLSLTIATFNISIIFAILYTMIVNNDFKTINLSSLGGAIGVLLVVLTYSIIYKEESKVVTHAYIRYLPLLYGLSKIACIFGHCCEGINYQGPLNMNGHFPIQPLEVITFIILFIILEKINKNNSSEITLITTLSLKFILDYLRISHVGIFISPNQLVCLIIVIISIIILIHKKNSMNKS